MFPTMLRSSLRSMSNSVRTPDSRVATRVSYGSALMTMSLVAFATLRPFSGNEIRRHLRRREPVGGKGDAQESPRRLERPDPPAGAMNHCNRELAVPDREIGDEGLEVDR